MHKKQKLNFKIRSDSYKTSSSKQKLEIIDKYNNNNQIALIAHTFQLKNHKKGKYLIIIC